ncbi:uncharacterized protein B0I36DRAFT_205301, partial [Microdochium trichocladiopsis]
VYALSLCGILIALFIARQVLPLIYIWCRALFLLVLRLFSYTFIINRHRWAGPWTISLILGRGIYVVSNAVCLLLPQPSRTELASRAGYLAATNITPLFLSFHLDFLANSLGLSRKTTQEVHKAAGVMTFALLLLHVSLSLDLEEVLDLCRIMVSTSVGLMAVLSIVPLRKHLYEVADKTHKALAVIIAFSTWQHISTTAYVQQWLLFTLIGMIGLVHAVQFLLFLYRNIRWGKPFPEADIIKDGVIVRIVLQLPRPIKIDAGQYISLSIVSRALGYWSWAQSHPFTITSWSPLKQDKLELYVQCRGGLTLQLLKEGVRNHLAFFSGPYGKSHSLKEAKCVLMLTTDFGIIAVCPYLKKITATHKCRAHLVWHVKRLSEFAPLVALLNNYLQDPTL